MRVFTSLEEYEAAVGTHLGTSSWVEVTQEAIDAFAEATGDHQWIHVDPGRAKDGPYGTTVAHGYYTLSLVPRLMAEIARVDNLKFSLNYGANKVRFPTSVPVGSRLRASAELVSVTPAKQQGYQAVNRVTIELEGSDKPACVADTVAIYVP